MPSLVDTAKAILRHAEDLEEQLNKISAPQPTLEAGGSLLYPSFAVQPDIWKTRAELADLSVSMSQLAMGPIDTVRGMVGPDRTIIEVIKVIDHFDIYTRVPQTGSISFKQLASDLGVQQELLERTMRMAFSVNMFVESPQGSISHTAISQALPELRAWVHLMCREDFAKCFDSWTDAMKQYTEPRKKGVRQIPWNIGRSSDETFFETLAAEKDGMRRFGEALQGHTKAMGGDTSPILLRFDWASLGKGPVVDLGGGNGHISIMVAKAFPELQMIVQDLPVNEPIAASVIPQEVEDRVTFQTQNFFEPQTIETGAKAYFMRAILHDWPDDDCVRILHHLLPALERGAKLFVHDRVLGAKPTRYESYSYFADLLMFTLLGAKERTITQWEKLFTQADPRLKILDVSHADGCLTVGF